jgi:hypothetical protein
LKVWICGFPLLESQAVFLGLPFPLFTGFIAAISSGCSVFFFVSSAAALSKASILAFFFDILLMMPPFGKPFTILILRCPPTGNEFEKLRLGLSSHGLVCPYKTVERKAGNVK